MEQIDKFVKDILNELQTKLEPYQIKYELSERLDRTLNEEKWPFKSVSKEYFLNAAVPFLACTQEIERVSDEIRAERAKEFIDRINYTSVDFLRCIQKMELDYMAQEPARYKANYNHQTSVFNQISLGEKLADLGKYLLNENNNRAIDLMEAQYTRLGKEPTRVTDASVRLYTFAVAEDMKNEAMQEHEVAYDKAIERSPSIMKYGLPQDSRTEKVAEVLMPHRRQEQVANETSLHDLAKAQAKMDHVENFVIFALKQEVARELLQAEAEEWVENEKRQANAARNGTVPVPFHSVHREIAQEKQQKIDAMEKQIKAYYARKAEAVRGMTLTIQRGENGVYTVTVQKANGEKVQSQTKQGDTERSSTVERNRVESTRTMELTQITQQVMEETKSFRAVFRSESESEMTLTHNQEKENEKKGHEKSQTLGEITASRTTKRDYKGNKKQEAKAAADLAKTSYKKVKKHNVGPKQEKKVTASLETKAIGASAKLTMPDEKHWGTPKASAEIHAADINASLGKLSMHYSAGAKISAGVQLTPAELVGTISDILFNETEKGDNANMTRIMDEVVDLIAKLPPSQTTDWSSLTFSVGDWDFLKVAVKDANQEKGVQDFEVKASSPILDTAKEHWQKAKDMFPFDNNEQQTPILPQDLPTPYELLHGMDQPYVNQEFFTEAANRFITDNTDGPVLGE